MDPGSIPPVEQLLREAAPAALGILVRRGEPFVDAEDAVQEAMIIALDCWPRRGLPDRPVGWVVRVAQRRLIDQHHRDTARRRREALVASWSAPPAEPEVSEDDSLLLLFLCCHRSLTHQAAIPLTLRAVGGLTTAEIARALLLPEATVAQRISRAKASIGRSSEPFCRPPADLVDDRLPAVMQVVYLVFTEGHASTSGSRVHRADLADEAVRLARILHERLPDRPEVMGLLALLLLTDARRAARTSADGSPVPLDRQDRSVWSRPKIVEGLRLLTAALAHHEVGPYQLQAAIAAVHDQAPSYEHTDWSRLRALYDQLLLCRDTPLVRLNRAVTVAHTDGPAAARVELETLSGSLADHHRFHATMGYLHEMVGDRDAASRAYEVAAGLATNEVERRYLRGKFSS